MQTTIHFDSKIAKALCVTGCHSKNGGCNEVAIFKKQLSDDLSLMFAGFVTAKETHRDVKPLQSLLKSLTSTGALYPVCACWNKW